MESAAPRPNRAEYVPQGEGTVPMQYDVDASRRQTAAGLILGQPSTTPARGGSAARTRYISRRTGQDSMGKDSRASHKVAIPTRWHARQVYSS